MRYDQIEKFISEGGDLDNLIIDQEPAHDADHTIQYFCIRASKPDQEWHKWDFWKKGVKHDRIR